MSITIGNITKKIKSNQQNVKINLVVNPEFEQTNVIKKRKKQNPPLQGVVNYIIFLENSSDLSHYFLPSRRRKSQITR